MSEQIRTAWEDLLKKLGAYELERRMSRLESYRTYNRRWPFDSRTTAINLDLVSETVSSDTPSLEEQIIMDQARESYLGTLTDKQVEIAHKLEQGYKPRDIAAQEGLPNSGSTRWQKHAIKQRIQEYRENPPNKEIN